MATKAIAAKKRIRDIVTTAVGDMGTVSWGNLKNVPKNWSMIGPTTWDTSDWGPIGKRSRDEQFRVECFITLTLPGGKPEDAEVKAMDMGDAIETALRDDPTLTGLSYNTQMLPRKLAGFAVDTGAQAEFTFDVQVKARI